MKKINAPERIWNDSNRPEKEKATINAPERRWGEMSGVMPPIPIRQFKGVNTLDPFSIDPAYATEIENLKSGEFPSLTVRPGNTLMGTQLTAKIAGLGVWKDTELHAIANGSWYKLVSNVWSAALATTLNADEAWSFCNFQGNLAANNLIGANGVDPVKRYDGTTVQNLTNAPANLNYIDQHNNRLYGAVGNSIFHSALSMVDDWSTVDDAGEILIETNDGETINGIKAGYNHLLIFKPSSVHELWGTEPLNYELKPVATDIGLLSNQCVTVIGNIPYWVDRNGIYMYGGSRPRKDFSIPVRGYIENLNQANKHKASAGTDGKNLYVALPYGTSTEPDTVLEYDPDFQTWYVWKDLSPLHFAKMGANWYMGDTAGKVLQVGGTTDNGTTVSWKWVSVPFGSGSRAQKLQWYRMWYVADVPTGSSMSVYLSKSAEGDSDWTLVKSVPADDLHSGRIIIPVEMVANSNWVRVKFEGSGPMQIHEFDYQQRALPMY